MTRSHNVKSLPIKRALINSSTTFLHFLYNKNKNYGRMYCAYYILYVLNNFLRYYLNCSCRYCGKNGSTIFETTLSCHPDVHRQNSWYTFNTTNLEDDKYCSHISGLLPISEVAPMKYDVELDVRTYEKIILGMSNITFHVWKPTEVIHLHSRGLDVDHRHTKIIKLNPFLENEEEIFYNLKNHKRCDKAQILILFLHEKYPGKYELNIKFSYSLKELFGIIHHSLLIKGIT